MAPRNHIGWCAWITLLSCGPTPSAESGCLAADPPPQHGREAPVVPRGPAAIVGAIKLAATETQAGGTLIATNGEAIDDNAQAGGLAVAVDDSDADVPFSPPPLLEAIVNVLADDRGGKKRRTATEKQRAAVMDQKIRACEANCKPQFERTLYIELAFLRRACEPEAKPFLEVAKAAKADLHVPLARYARWACSPRLRQNPPAQSEAAIGDPALAVQNLVTRFAEAKLGPEKVRLYRQECDKRTEARKHAAILNAVAGLDERLLLTAPQRAALVESLSAKYKHSSVQSCPIFASDGQDFRSVPEVALLPLLNEKQKLVWREAVKQQDAEVEVEDALDNVPDIVEAAGIDEIGEIARLVEEVKDGR